MGTKKNMMNLQTDYLKKLKPSLGLKLYFPMHYSRHVYIVEMSLGASVSLIVFGQCSFA